MTDERASGHELVPRPPDERWSALSSGDLLREGHLRVERGEPRAALPLLQEALDREPHRVPALLLMARCQLRLGDAVRALEFARQARRRATGPRADAARRIFDECVRAASDDLLEALRTAVRNGRLVSAATLADEIVAARPDDDGVANVHAYVYERMATSSSATTRARAGACRGGVRSLTPQALQATLAWLGRDEIEEGAAAIGAGDFARAAAVLDGITRVDERGAKAGYLQATAMYRSVLADLAGPAPTGLAAAATNLRGAATLARRAAATPEFAARARRLLAEIDDLSGTVADELAVRPIARPFDALRTRYLGRTITEFEASTFRRSLASLRIETEAAQRRCRPGSGGARRLARIHAEIVHLQRQLRWV